MYVYIYISICTGIYTHTYIYSIYTYRHMYTYRYTYIYITYHVFDLFVSTSAEDRHQTDGPRPLPHRRLLGVPRYWWVTILGGSDHPQVIWGYRVDMVNWGLGTGSVTGASELPTSKWTGTAITRVMKTSCDSWDDLRGTLDLSMGTSTTW